MTAQPLLATKLNRPTPLARRVCRERLLELIDRGVERPLTLISAAAGSGKSTLLIDWIERRGRRVAWLSLDEGDNDLSRFLTYLIAGLRSLHRALAEEALAMLRGPRPPELELWLTEVVNTVHRAAEADGVPLILVLDDYHLINNAEIHQVVEGLVERAAGALRLIVATRVDPPWTLARMRVRGQLIEIRGAELGFTRAEASDFLNGTMALQLTPRLVGVIEERTEGWIAGLQLAALSLKGRGDAADFIQQFTGGHRFIFDYLSDEVLGLQSPRTLSFLLATSILERLCSDLCDEVLGRDDSQQRLEELEHSNLFLIALDDERCWYRYHHLFAKVLGRQLEQRQTVEETAELHCRASDWYAARDLAEDALRHAVAATDVARAEGLILTRAPKLFMSGDASTLLRWLENLPESWFESHPATLGMSYIWALMLALRWREGRRWLRRLEDPLAAAGIPALDAQLAGLRGLMARGEGDLDTAIELYHQVLKHDGDDTLFVRGTTSFDLGVIYLAIDDLVTAEQMFKESWSLNRAAGHELFTVWSRFYLAEIQAARGALRESLEICREILADEGGEADSPRPILSLPYAQMADVHREWDELDIAHQLATQAVEHARRGGLPVGLLTAYSILARVESARRAFPEALAALDAADQLARRVVLPGMADLLLGYRARVLLCQARSEGRSLRSAEVESWLMERDLLSPEAAGLRSTFLPAEHCDNAILAQIHLRLERGESERPLELLPGLEQTARRAGRSRARIEILILTSFARQRGGDHDAALAALCEALELAEPGGFVRLFFDEGMALGQLLGQALEEAKGLSASYVERLRRFSSPVGDLDSPTTGHQEPLSKRELEVLRVVATGASNQETARCLFISPATVKKHLENIYSKLRVRNRMEAVAKARELG